jgi:hypothetical protein
LAPGATSAFMGAINIGDAAMNHKTCSATNETSPTADISSLKKVVAGIAVSLPVARGAELAAALAIASDGGRHAWAKELETEVRRILRLRNTAD